MPQRDETAAPLNTRGETLLQTWERYGRIVNESRYGGDMDLNNAATVKALDEARICLYDAAQLSLNINNAESWCQRFREAAQAVESLFYAGHEGVVPKVGWDGWWVGVHNGKVVCEANDLMVCEHSYAERLADDPVIQAMVDHQTDDAPPWWGDEAEGALCACGQPVEHLNDPDWPCRVPERGPHD